MTLSESHFEYEIQYWSALHAWIYWNRLQWTPMTTWPMDQNRWHWTWVRPATGLCHASYIVLYYRTSIGCRWNWEKEIQRKRRGPNATFRHRNLENNMNFYQLYAERSNKRWQATNRSTRIVDERMHLLKCNSFRADGSKPWDVPSLTNLLQNCRLFLSIFFRCKKEACTGRPFRGKYLGTVKVKRENEPLTGHNTTDD